MQCSRVRSRRSGRLCIFPHSQLVQKNLFPGKHAEGRQEVHRAWGFEGGCCRRHQGQRRHPGHRRPGEGRHGRGPESQGFRLQHHFLRSLHSGRHRESTGFVEWFDLSRHWILSDSISIFNALNGISLFFINVLRIILNVVDLAVFLLMECEHLRALAII